MICYLHARVYTRELAHWMARLRLKECDGRFKVARIAHRDDQTVPPETDHNNLIVLTNSIFIYWKSSTVANQSNFIRSSLFDYKINKIKKKTVNAIMANHKLGRIRPNDHSV